MDIRTVSEKEKADYIAKIRDYFSHIRAVIDTLDKDIESEDLMIQTSAVWVSGNMATWFSDFMTQIRNIEKEKKDIQKQMLDALTNETKNQSTII